MKKDCTAESEEPDFHESNKIRVKQRRYDQRGEGI